MNEDLYAARWSQVERLNGPVRTWWHYNRFTLAILLTAIAGLMAIVEIERGFRRKAEAEAIAVATAALKESFLCYTHERSTSLLIAGGSHKQVYDALYAAEEQASGVRLAMKIVESKLEKEKK